MDKMFYEYNINSDIKKISQVLGYLKPSEIQKEIIEEVLEKENLFPEIPHNYLIGSPAGSGKTFSFLLFFFDKFNFTLKKLQGMILVPTRELAYQTVSYFDKINSANVNNTFNTAEMKINYKVLVGGSGGGINKKEKNSDDFLNDPKDETQVIVGTLGKIYSSLSKKLSKKKNISNELKKYLENLQLLIIDEADKMIFQNKDNIFKNFLKLIFNSEIKYRIKPALILGSASFDQKSMNFYLPFAKELKIIQKKEKENFVVNMSIENSNNFHNSSTPFKSLSNATSASNIKEYFHIFKSQIKETYFEQKYQILFEMLNNLNKHFKQCLIFYNQKGRGEELAADLRDYGYPTTFIHGDLSQDQRILIYDKIRNLEVKVVLATDLFSRGIDLSTVDLVINFDSPFNETEYFHRVGRTGRYNSYGVSVSFFQENEVKILEQIKSQDEEKRIHEIESFNEAAMNQFRRDLEKVQELNKISQELQEKVKKLEIEANELNPSNSDTMINKKRRREQYNKESMISEWVEVDHKLYNQDEFKYVEEDNQPKCCLYCNFFKIFEDAIIEDDY